MSGHAAREYKLGKRMLCGVVMPEGMKENDKFPEPIITPATKAEMVDHDEDISRDDILFKIIVTSADYEVLEQYTLAFFLSVPEPFSFSFFLGLLLPFALTRHPLVFAGATLALTRLPVLFAVLLSAGRAANRYRLPSA